MLKREIAGGALVRLLGVCALLGLASMPAQALAPIEGWTALGLVDGLDTVESLKSASAEGPVLEIEKRSPYQAGQVLQVFKSFAATPWRAKRIRVSFALATTLAIDTRALDGIQPQLQVRMQCETASQTSSHSIPKAPSKYPALTIEMVVPKDATVCGFGFALFKPMKMTVSNLRFTEIIAAPAPVVSMEEGRLFPAPQAGSSLSDLDVAKPPKH